MNFSETSEIVEGGVIFSCKRGAEFSESFPVANGSRIAVGGGEDPSAAQYGAKTLISLLNVEKSEIP